MVRAAIVLSIVLFAARAAADPATADKLAAEAADLASRNLFKEASAKFAQAYKEDSSRPVLYCNIGITAWKAGDLPRAHLLLSQCLNRAALEQSFVDTARAVLKQVEETLRSAGHTPVTFTVSPDATSIVIEELGTETMFLGSRTVWLAFGTYHVAATAENHTPKRAEVSAVDQNPVTIDVKLERPVAIVQPPPLPTTALPVTRPSKLPAIVATGATAVVIGLAIVAYGRAHEAADDAPFAIDEAAFKADKKTISKWNTVMGVSAGFAVAGAVASTFLWLRATGRSSKTVEVSPAPGGAKVSFGFRF